MPDTTSDPPEAPQPIDAAQQAARPKRYSADYENRLDAYFSHRGVPPFILEMVGLAWLIADTFGRVDFWRSVISSVGGKADMISEVLAQPVFPLLLIAFGAYMWWFLTDRTTDAYNRAIYSSLCWLLSAVVMVPLMSVALFANFVSSSNIPGFIEYVVRQQQDRGLTNKQATLLYAALRKVPNTLLAFQVFATHDPETLQYAYRIMQVLYSANVKLLNGEAGSAEPTATDIYNTSGRGIMFVVANPMAPPKGALDLRDAFDAAHIATQFILGTGAHGDDMMLLVGPK